MRAAVVTAPGTPPVAGDFPEPPVADGEESFELVGAGIHRVVRGLASGAHYGSDGRYPQVIGVDAVARAADGRLVYTGGIDAPWGTFAERLSAPMSVDLPAGADPLAIAAGVNGAMSGWMPLSARKAQAGGLGTVVVVGATGTSGGMAVQEAVALGADKVVALGRRVEGLRRLEDLGARTIPLDEDAVAALSAELAEQQDILILDYVWGPPAASVFSALERHGRGEDRADISYVQIGSLAGQTAALPASLLRSRRIRVSGSGLGGASMRAIMAEMPKIMALIADGTLRAPYVSYPLSRIGEAWSYAGPERVVVVPD